jgi:hypothetical protein
MRKGQEKGVLFLAKMIGSMGTHRNHPGLYTYTYIPTYTYIHVYIYIYIERERCFCGCFLLFSLLSPGRLLDAPAG